MSKRYSEKVFSVPPTRPRYGDRRDDPNYTGPRSTMPRRPRTAANKSGAAK